MDQVNSTRFKDKKGTEWDLELTLGDARRIDKADFSAVTTRKFSFVKPTKEDYAELVGNHGLIYAITEIILLPQMKEKLNLDYEPDQSSDHFQMATLELASRMSSQCIADAREAYYNALLDFYQDQKTGLSALLKMQKEAQSQMTLLVEKQMPLAMEILTLEVERADKAIEKEMKTLAEKLGEESTKSQESSDGQNETTNDIASEDSSLSLTPTA